MAYVLLLLLRQCQKTDWSNGIPIPHKVFCGEKQVPNLSEAKVGHGGPQKNEPDLDGDRFPPPDHSFKRTPALLYQLKLLNGEPFPDYFVRLNLYY